MEIDLVDDLIRYTACETISESFMLLGPLKKEKLLNLFLITKAPEA